MSKDVLGFLWYHKLYVYVIFGLQIVDLVLVVLAYKADTNTNKAAGVLVATLFCLLCAVSFFVDPTSHLTIVVLTIATVTSVLSILTHVLKTNKVLWVLTLLCRSLALLANVVGISLIHSTAPTAFVPHTTASIMV